MKTSPETHAKPARVARLRYLTARAVVCLFLLGYAGGSCETEAQYPATRSVGSKGNDSPARETGNQALQPPPGDETTSDLSPTIYETNFKSNTVQAFSSAGANLGVFCNVVNPTGLVFDQSGNLFVSSDDSAGYSIQKFAPDGSSSVFAPVV